MNKYNTQMDARLHTGCFISWKMTDIYARAQKQVEHEIRQMLGKVQDEVTERWAPRLGEASRASGGRKNLGRGTMCDLRSRIR